MRKPLMALLLLGTAACNAADTSETSSTEGLQTFEVSEDAASEMRAPSISPTAAPGVAFDYRYAFRLPADRISEVQEQHTQACEKLGIDKCRITGMLYELVGEDEVRAQLALKLDPAIARRFGKEGTDLVVRAEGELRRAQISGTDVGSLIDSGRRRQLQIEEELKQVEQQLARRGLGAAERAELQAQAQSLRDQLRSGQQAQADRREQLANTPMVFDYAAGDVDATLGGEARRSLDRFAASATMLLILLVYLLPWALLLVAAFFALRWARRRFAPARATVVEPASGSAHEPAQEGEPRV